MSFNVESPSVMQPLSLGNVINAGVQLYRSHLKSYIRLAFIAYLWMFIPIYGWAKLLANLALISRLAFGELVNQPEEIETGRRFVNSRLWQFLCTSLLMIIIIAFLIILISITSLITLGSLGGLAVVANNIFSGNNVNIVVLTYLLTVIFFLILIITALCISTRFLLVEIPLAVEENVSAVSTIGRSWDLTNRYVWRIMLILFVAYLITIPIQLPFSILSNVIPIIINPLIKDNSNYGVISLIISLIFSLGSAILVAPFWQSIKAVIYYDLRTRREGLGLKLREHNI
ncbi:DUF975 domain-containing protein [Aetokthonos hydrillicola Thurmond2011]|jgi:hypothetical protein|uniref:DUF975 domain-containing protein n=1 Tax=Aetokthonos hydrillicola Thurmond2011 TaxID=2712845 RepID=A0AAP5ICU8_9CYAN|nr:DUF975 domain-containing protein [Aetokthonos hydrillicola]MBO3463309.1 DUF975 domain-containing protein [Aetokthonos hydrillicola CCALA 1050]MBW4585712.1 DUF975 domain-containing protein [Aetokthonos hydrillicola CCALA 1050]MDR9899216.1 DUF975 domain-containing protein [Aetokthonos hydrillicola Thurmond2011]